jgi:hypothetical protein
MLLSIHGKVHNQMAASISKNIINGTCLKLKY